MQIALVVEGDQLKGTLTDGDIRRALLRGMGLKDPVFHAMNDRPTVASLGDDRELVIARMRQAHIRQMPILDSSGALVGMEILNGLVTPEIRSNAVVLMAGGLGKRLTPLTNDCPKSMLKIGGRPILETILETFIAYGFRRFYISVNYKADVIMDYFRDGSRWQVQITYLQENKRLGTAGALSLLPEKPMLPLIVMNGDILTKINFNHLLDFHNTHKAKATMCVSDYEYQVPFGVITLNGHQIMQIQEKPTQKFFINAGIYALDPDVLDLVPKDDYDDMTTLFERIVGAGWQTSVFPICEYWLDIGRHSDLDKANGDLECRCK